MAAILQILLAAMLVLCGVPTASAQNYPNRPVRVVVGFPAGGPTDVIARMVSQKLSDTLGQQFFVENIGGARGEPPGGPIRAGHPDGFTLPAVWHRVHGHF